MSKKLVVIFFKHSNNHIFVVLILIFFKPKFYTINIFSKHCSQTIKSFLKNIHPLETNNLLKNSQTMITFVSNTLNQKKKNYPIQWKTYSQRIKSFHTFSMKTCLRCRFFDVERTTVPCVRPRSHCWCCIILFFLSYSLPYLKR